MSDTYSKLSKIPDREKATTGFALSLIGGILVLIQGLLIIVSSAFIWHMMESMMRNVRFLPRFFTLIGVIAMAFGLIIIIGSILIYKPNNETIGGIIVLVFSIISFFIGGGFIIGSILGIIGGILGLLKK